MPRKKTINPEIPQEETPEDPVVSRDIFADSPGDSFETLAYKEHLRKYKEQNPKKFEAKRKEFAQKLGGKISIIRDGKTTIFKSH